MHISLGAAQNDTPGANVLRSQQDQAVGQSDLPTAQPPNTQRLLNVSHSDALNAAQSALDTQGSSIPLGSFAHSVTPLSVSHE
jgi:hypothetical protein